MPKLIIASRNKGKIKEISEILSDLPLQIISLNDLKIKDLLSESGNSYQENAIFKAKTIGQKTNLLTIADDSGLEIDVLDGKPGVRSARYVNGSDLDRINRVLDELEGVPSKKRTARFVAVVALYCPFDNKVYTFKGLSYGCITDKPHGQNGFGYDPIFYNFDLDKTNGQATYRQKNRVSHRVRALIKAKQLLFTFIFDTKLPKS